MHIEGLIIGIVSFLIIGIFHPIVIKTEYYFGKKCWWIFLLAGLLFIFISLIMDNLFVSIIAGLVGFTCLWSIKELLEQEKRVQKGWFPFNPHKKGDITIRPETAADYETIRQINTDAFNQSDEAFLIEKLRKNPVFNPKLSLIAIKNGFTIGHILFIPVEIENERGEISQILSLSPIAVRSLLQKQGIGKVLIKEGFDAAKKEGYQSVIVLGDPNYYQKFGFMKASIFNIKCPYNVPEEYFMAIELSIGGLKQISGTIRYPKEFALLG